MSSINNLYQRFLKLKTQRQSLENLWKECYRFALPQRQGIFSDTSTNPAEHLFDGTAPDAVDQLAACIFSELTPAWTTWFNLVSANQVKNEDAQALLDDISQTLSAHLNLSNFSVEMHQCFLDLRVSQFYYANYNIFLIWRLHHRLQLKQTLPYYLY